MAMVTSKDGTQISYARTGSGPALILVGGALDDGSENVPLARALARSCTVFNYARRGRGASGDTEPYALAREIEDLRALVTEAGGTAGLHGVSSGGALALEAVAAGLPVTRLSVYEVPYDMTEGAPRRHHAYTERLGALLDSGDTEGALAHAMRTFGSPAEQVETARNSPMWPELLELAPTLRYDAACLGDGVPSTERLATISQPVLVLDGELGAEFFGPAADAIAASIQHSRRRTLAGQGHVADPEHIAGILAEFHSG